MISLPHVMVLVLALGSASGCSDQKSSKKNASSGNDSELSGDPSDSEGLSETDSGKREGSGSPDGSNPSRDEEVEVGHATCNLLYGEGEQLFADLTVGASTSCQNDADCVAIVELKTSGCGDSLGTAIARSSLKEVSHTQLEALRAQVHSNSCQRIPDCLVSPRLIKSAKCDTATKTCSPVVEF